MPTNFSEDGSFELSIDTAQLVRGLRPTKRAVRDSGFLVECEGAVGFDGALQIIDQLTRLDTSAMNTAFPYPQIFVFTNVIIVCNETTIYEWVGGSLISKLSGLTAGSTWVAVDYYDYIYLSNGRVAVVRDSSSKVYATSSLPHATAACNFNGQLMIGAPDVDIDVVALVYSPGLVPLTLTVYGNAIVGLVMSDIIKLSLTLKGDYS